MSEEAPRKRPGREPGKYKKFPTQHAVRFTAAQWEHVSTLSEWWKVSEAEVIRVAVQRLAEAEKLAAPPQEGGDQ